MKVRWPIIARSIDTHAFLPWRFCDSLEGVDSLRGLGGQGRAIDDGNTYFSISLPPPQTGVTGSGNSAQQKALHLLSSVWGEGKGH